MVPETAVIPNVTAAELWNALNNGSQPLVIDVREPYEFANGHIPFAQLMPMPQIMSRQTAVPCDQPVVLICRSGRRSTQVLYKLQKEEGYSNLTNLDGGMLAWESAGLPAVID